MVTSLIKGDVLYWIQHQNCDRVKRVEPGANKILLEPVDYQGDVFWVSLRGIYRLIGMGRIILAEEEFW